MKLEIHWASCCRVAIGHRLFVLASWLLAGGLATACVAWMHILVFLPPGVGEEISAEEAAALIESAFQERKEIDQCHGNEQRRMGWSRKIAECYTGDARWVLHVTVLSAGWPAYCLRGSMRWSPGSRKYERALELPEWMTPRTRRMLVEFLPLRPIWPGFAINTLFYALLVWLLCRALLHLRSFIRRRRGLCPACAFPKGESPVCVECGR